METPEALDARTRALIASDRVTGPTRRALLTRLERRQSEPRVLSIPQLATLRAAAARLVPLEGLRETLDLAGRFDEALAEGPGDGWRYAALPPDREAQPRGLDALDAAARSAHGRAFVALEATAQDVLLTATQAGSPPGPPWPFPPELWFEELLAALVRLAYAHPLVQVSIGYDGFADAHGMPPDA